MFLLSINDSFSPNFILISFFRLFVVARLLEFFHIEIIGIIVTCTIRCSMHGLSCACFTVFILGFGGVVDEWILVGILICALGGDLGDNVVFIVLVCLRRLSPWMCLWKSYSLLAYYAQNWDSQNVIHCISC